MTQGWMVHEMYLEVWKRAAENLTPDEKPYTMTDVKILSDYETVYGRMLIAQWDYEELDGEEGNMPTIATGWWYVDGQGEWHLHNLIAEYDVTPLAIKGFD